MTVLAPRDVDILHWHIFCGIGGGADGFNAASPRVGHLRGRLVCLGGVDSDPAAIADFETRTRTKGTVLDLFSREQYATFHGKQPPPGWREATVDDIRASAQHRRPNIVFGSAPCKGFSGLLAEKAASSPRYAALNQLAIRGLRLALEAWADDPPEFWLWENVPRIQTRGAEILDVMRELLESFDYATNPAVYDCGELGELGQHRDRFLLACRHKRKVPPYLFQPRKRRVKSVGEILGAGPLPDDPAAGPMHRMRQLKFKTWKRLAFVKAGSDWRSLKDLRVQDGVLVDYALQPMTRWHNGTLGVTRWTDPAGTVIGSGRPHNGAFSVADPRPPHANTHGQLGVTDWSTPSGVVTGESYPTNGRFAVADPRPTYTGEYKQLGVKRWGDTGDAVTGQSAPGGGAYSVADPRPQADERYGGYGVNGWDESSPTIIGVRAPGQGKYSVADPRLSGERPRYNNVFRVVRWDETSQAVTGGGGPSAGGQAIADPRYESFGQHYGKMRVEDWNQPAHVITGSDRVGSGALSVADPRPNIDRGPGDAYLTSRHYGVVPWDAATGVISAAASHDNGAFSVADPREPMTDSGLILPGDEDRLVAIIQALDGTWHRPFTTLELAWLQSLAEPGEWFTMHGVSDTAWRERIGNAVPKLAAKALGELFGQTLLLAWAGETFVLSDTDVWVQPVAVALSVDVQDLPI